MDGFKDVDYYIKAVKMGVVPKSPDTWGMRHDPGAYHDLHKDFPVIGDGNENYNGSYNTCAIINKKLRTYETVASSEDKVQRLCRGLILKYNLSNL